MARSRSPIGSSMSQSSRMRSTSWAEKMFRGKGWPSLGSSSSEAGLCSRWLPGHPSEPHPQGDQARVLCPYPADAKQRAFPPGRHRGQMERRKPSPKRRHCGAALIQGASAEHPLMQEPEFQDAPINHAKKTCDPVPTAIKRLTAQKTFLQERPDMLPEGKANNCGAQI